MPNRAEPDWNNISNNGYVHPFATLGISRPNINNFSEWRNPETWKISLLELENILNNGGLNPELPEFDFKKFLERDKPINKLFDKMTLLGA